MPKKVEEIQEQRDVRELKARLDKLPPWAHKMLLEEIAAHTCFGTAKITREWLDHELKGYERIEHNHERTAERNFL